MEKENNVKTSVASEVLQEKATTFFTENPKVKKVFGTADEFLFTVKKYAVNHAQTLENTEVFSFKNPNSIKVIDPEELDEDSDDDDPPASGIASTQKITQ
jgi:hypothetical protein